VGNVKNGRDTPPASASLQRLTLVAAAYAALAVVMTWPLARGLGSDVPGDLGDSLLNMWILGWGAELVPRVLTGQASLHEYWNANIFHPEPLALGFSEHLFGEVLQILPAYWVTGNLILCYNLLFLSSFVLSGLGVFVLVRDLLRHPSADVHVPAPSEAAITAAAFVAGLLFAFVPFRIAQVAHIQSLHAQWMPFALYGLRRYVIDGKTRALIGGSAALLMQHWSNGYYMIYFAPFVPAFVLHQLWIAGKWRDGRTWLSLVAAALVVSLGTWPFLSLYLETQRVHAFERPLGEVIAYSADVYSYLTAPEALRWWAGVMNAYPKPEGELFFGAAFWMLAALALATLLYAQRDVFDASRDQPRVKALAVVILAIIAVQVIGVLAIVFTGGFITSVAGIPIRATNSSRILVTIAAATTFLVVFSTPIRHRIAVTLRSPLILCAVFAMLAMWLSLGPLPQSRGRVLSGMGLYSLLYEYAPGFAGLRVPARYAMVAAMFLSVVAGYGALALTRRARPVAVAAGLTLAILADTWFAPMPLNLTSASVSLPPAPRIYPREHAPAVYHQLANLRPDAVVAEFPFGDVTWELRYVYYSTVHWRRLINGYSGGFPQGYRRRVALLQRVRDNPEAAWKALRDAGATHVVVHESAYPPGEATIITQWLADHFAVEIARFDDDLLFDVTGVWPPK
jgi:hypothetical protein